MRLKSHMRDGESAPASAAATAAGVRGLFVVVGCLDLDLGLGLGLDHSGASVTCGEGLVPLLIPRCLNRKV